MVVMPLEFLPQNYWFAAAAVMLLANESLLLRPIRWIVAWVLTSLFVTFYAMSTGTALTLASLPVALWMVGRAWRDERRSFLYFCCILAAIIGLLCVITPFGRVAFSLVRYLAENAAINAVANGVPWGETFGKGLNSSTIMSSGFLTELLRLAWIFGIVIIGIVAWKEATGRPEERNQKLLVLSALVGFFPLALTAYSFGRINPGLPRSGFISVWMLTFAFPVLLATKRSRTQINSAIIILAAVGAACYALMGGQLPEVSRLSSRAVAAADVRADQLRGNPALPNLGNMVLDPYRQDGLSELQQVLKGLLRAGETFLDLTNHSARYFFLGYPVPILEPAIYNAPAATTQDRIIGQLVTSPPPVILIEGDNITWDGAVLPLRAGLVYRHVMSLGYLPIKRGRYILLAEPERGAKLSPVLPEDHLYISTLTNAGWMNGISKDGRQAAFLPRYPADIENLLPGDKLIFPHAGERLVTGTSHGAVLVEGGPLDPLKDGGSRKVRIRRMHSLPAQASEAELREVRLSLLDSAFRVGHLQKIPVGWGRSWGSISPLIKETARYRAAGIGNAAVSPGGLSSGLRLVYPTEGLRVSDAQYLAFNLSCSGNRARAPELVVQWIESDSQSYDDKRSIRFYGEEGLLLVPLDSSPRWFMSRSIGEVRITLTEQSSCEGFDVEHIRFFKRTSSWSQD